MEFDKKKMKGVAGLLGAMVILTLVFFLPVLQSGRVFCFRDIPRYFYPLKFYAAQELQAGRMPLWNPQLFSGMPFFANLQSAVLYPLSLITDLFPFPQCFNWYVIAHFILGGFFMALLARDWTGRWTAALISALTFAFGGFLVSVIDMNSTLASVVWLPLVVLLFKRAMGTRPLPYFILGALSLGLVFLGGEPTVFVETFLILLALVLFLPATPAEPLCRRSEGLLRLGLFFGLALLLIAVQVLPFLELLSQSLRSQGTPAGNALAWSLPPSHLLTFFFPFLFGGLQDPNHYQGSQLWLNSFYVGILPFLLAVIAFKKREKKDVLWLWSLALLGLVLSLGLFTPVYPWLYEHTLIFKWIRYPIKFMLLTSFALSLLAGIGWHELNAQSAEFKKRLTYTFVALTAIGIGLYLLLDLGKDEVVRYLVRGKKPSLQEVYALVLQYEQGLKMFLRTLSLVAGAALVFFAVQRGKVHEKFIALFAIALVFGDLYGVHHNSFHTALPSFYTEKPGNLKLLTKPGRLFLTQAAEDKGKVVFAETYDQALTLAKQSFFANTLADFGAAYVSGYDSLTRQDYEQYLALLEAVDLNRSHLLDVSHARYVVSSVPLKAKKFSLLIKKPSFVYENTAVLPRAYVVGRAVAIPERGEALKALSGPVFDPRLTVVVDAQPGQVKGDSRWSRPATAKFLEDGPGNILLQTDLKEKGFLVLSDSFYPGWQAEMDGKRVPIFRANGGFRVVAVPAGRNEVHFHYNPGPYRVGLALSLATLLTCLAASMFSARKNNLRRRFRELSEKS